MFVYITNEEKWYEVAPCDSSWGCLLDSWGSPWNHPSPSQLMSWTLTAGCTRTPPSRYCSAPPSSAVNTPI